MLALLRSALLLPLLIRVHSKFPHTQLRDQGPFGVTLKVLFKK